jgi:hypothetical protein
LCHSGTGEFFKKLFGSGLISLCQASPVKAVACELNLNCQGQAWISTGMVLFSDEEERRMDSEVDQSTDEGSIQANELEI